MTKRTRLWANFSLVLRAMLPYKRQYWRSYTLYIIGVTGGVVSAGVMLPIILRNLIDALSLPAGNADVWSIWGQIIVLSVIALLSTALADISISRNIPWVQRDVDTAIFRHIHRLSYDFFTHTPLGALVSKSRRFSDATDELDFHLSRGVYVVIIQGCASIGVLLRSSWPLALLFAAWGAMYLTIVLPIIRKKMRLDLQKSALESHVTAQFADTVTNALSVKTFAASTREADSFHEIATQRSQVMQQSWYATSAMDIAQSTIVMLMQAGFLAVALMLWQSGRIGVGTVVMAQTYFLILSQQLHALSNHLKSLFRLTAQCVEMAEITEKQPDVTDPPSPNTLHITRGDITLHNVSFRYPNGTLALHDLSLRIPSGQRVGLTGRSGSGKSTLTRLILRFADPTSGAVLIDDCDIRSITQDTLRSQIGYVPQDITLFHRSVRDNIAYARPDADDAAIRRAAQLAHADAFITLLPDGYDTTVGERGIQLSGGERQRIAIARAFLQDAPIMILDEATSALDTVSEELIRDALETLLQGRTVIVIAHRLSTVRRLDRILVLDDGTIAEDGTHAELLKHGALYQSLCTAFDA